MATASSATSANTGAGATVAALREGKTIVWIDAEHRKVTGSVDLAGGATLVGFDVRPLDGKLYGVTRDGAIVVLDPKTGMWEKVSQTSEPLPAEMTMAVDFNPVADRLRIIAANGMSLRVNVEDGKATVDGSLKYVDGDPRTGKQPSVTAAAYTNSVAGSKETALYDVDAAASSLVRQAPPNDGILTTVGRLGITIDGPAAFDIWSDGRGMNVGWLLAGGRLHAVDLMTGSAKPSGTISGLTGRIIDLAILPAM
jgi:hypothetical protein